MTEWKLKRFWTEASVSETEGGYAVLLDGRGVKTPAKTSLVVPTVELARAIADEWDAQEGTIDPTSMPFTRSANAAIDQVTHQFDEVVNLLAEYGETDLLCYRADSPIELTQRQAQAWDPLLSWAKDTLGADLSPANGVMFVEQPARSLNHLKTVLLDQSAFQLTATYDLISISGSLILGLAVSVHRVARPHHLAAFAFNLANKLRQVVFNIVMAEARNQRDASGFIFRVQLVEQGNQFVRLQ